MFYLKSTISNKDKIEILETLSKLSDPYGDFYLTKNSLRLYIKENPNLLFSYLKKGDKIVFSTEGIAIITGYADKTITIYDRDTGLSKTADSRKYVKILAENEKVAGDLIKFINWNINEELFTKIKINNPFKSAFLKNEFIFMAGRGKETLLRRLKKQGVKS